MRRARGAAALGVAVALAASSCAGSHVKTRRDDGFERAFANGEVLPGFRYYVYPLAELPEAILGIREGVQLEEGKWRRLWVTPSVIRRYVEGLGQAAPGGPHSVPPAQAILGADGEVLGFWVSAKPLPPTLLPVEGVLSVPLPLAPAPGGVAPGRRPRVE